MVNELYVLPYSSVTTPTNDGYSRMGCTWATPLMPYGNLWRTHRKLFHRFFNSSASSQFDDKIRKAVGVFLRQLSESPEHFLKHAHLYVGPCSIFREPRARCLPLTGKPYRVFDPVDCIRVGHKI